MSRDAQRLVHFGEAHECCLDSTSCPVAEHITRAWTEVTHSRWEAPCPRRGLGQELPHMYLQHLKSPAFETSCYCCPITVGAEVWALQLTTSYLSEVPRVNLLHPMCSVESRCWHWMRAALQHSLCKYPLLDVLVKSAANVQHHSQLPFQQFTASLLFVNLFRHSIEFSIGTEDISAFISVGLLT